MAKAMKICKVCGKEYEACHTPNPGVWRWRDVACCYEHGLKYLHDVQVARGEIIEEQAPANDTTMLSASCATEEPAVAQQIEYADVPVEEPEEPTEIGVAVVRPTQKRTRFKK